MFNTALTLSDLGFLLQGALMTLAVTAVSVTAGTILGVIFGVVRNQVGPYWAAPLTFVLDVFRSVPLLIQLVLGNAFQSIAKLGWPPFTTSCVVLSLYTAAYCTEIVRGGISSVPPTTRRAARSLGMTWWQDMRYIVAPLATRVSLPSWIGLTLGVMQQVIRAFGRVEDSFQYLVRSWTTIVSLISIYKRLRAFEATLRDEPLDVIEGEALPQQ